jgi:uncharacterized protein
MPITALYAAVLAVLFVFLSIRIIRVRHHSQVALGDGGNPSLLRAIRVHANFAEYVPFALLLLALVESLHANAWLLHGLGIALCIGRLSHAFGVSQTQENFRFRVFGTTSTFTVILICAMYLLAAQR